MTKQLNTRLPQITHDQLDEIALITGLTKTQVLIMAIDRLHQQIVNPQQVTKSEQSLPENK